MFQHSHSNQQFDVVEAGLKVFGISGNEAICICPFHIDHHPSASINLTTGLFFCFACGQASTIEEISRKLGGRVIRTNHLAIKRVYDNEWRSMLNCELALGNDYLKERGVSEEQVRAYSIRQFHNGVIFPITNTHGHNVGVLIRLMDGPVRYLSFGEKLPLWPLKRLHAERIESRPFIVEGVFGALRARRSGIVAYASMGAMIQRSIMTYMTGRNPIGFFDNDFAGYVAAGRLTKFIPGASAIVPGGEADELSDEEWWAMAKHPVATRSVQYLSYLSRNKSKFYRSL